MNDPDTSAAAAPASTESPLAEPVADTSADGSTTPSAAAASPPGEPEPGLPDAIPHAGVRYAALRLLMFGAVGAVLYIAGLRGWLLAIAAILISGLVSLFLLMKQRNDAAVNLERTVEGWRHRHDHEAGELTEG